MLNSIPNRNGRRISSTFLLIILALGFTSGLLVVVPSAQSAHAESLGQWTSATPYPIAITGESCAVSGGYVYCVGGMNASGASNTVYFAPISSSGVGPWTSTSSYPQDFYNSNPFYGGACVTTDGFIYCVALGNAYYAPVSSSGVGTWAATTGLPSVTLSTPIGNFTSPPSTDACVASQDYIYCVGVLGTIIGPDPPDPVYFAQLSSSGIGAWTSTTTYPDNAVSLSCASSQAYVYCIGGAIPPFPGSEITTDTNDVYYAQILSSGGLGGWTSTTSYPPLIAGHSCTSSSSYLYCVGGDIYTGDNGDPSNGATGAAYFAQITPTSQGGGVPDWITTNPYPVDVEGQSCVVGSSGYAYCIGGTAGREDGVPTSAVYYSQISSQLPPTSELTVNTFNDTNGVNAITGYYTSLYDPNGTLVAMGFSPVTFTLDSGQPYIVQVDDYGSCYFTLWSDISRGPVQGGVSSSPSRTISIAGNVSITAFYQCSTTGPYPRDVTVNSVDQNGNAIFGYYTILSNSDGDLIASGFTTDSFETQPGQTYSIQADSYGGCTFTNWSDGATSDPRTFTATTGQLSFIAIYECAQGASSSTINVSTTNSTGNPITGIYATLSQGGAEIRSCFSPCSFTVFGGETYQITVDNGVLATGVGERFSHWSDNAGSVYNWGGSRTVSVPATSMTISLTAVFSP